jgi:serine/threonine protein kinase
MSDPDDERTVIRPKKTPVPAAAALPPTDPSSGGGGNALPVGTQLGEFELTGVVGEGGFGIVYLAYDRSLQRRVALKEYMPSALAARGPQGSVTVKSARHRETFDLGLESFINEARLLAQFDHPSLVKVFRFWEASGTAFMAMPYYEGTTLKDEVRTLGAPPDEAWLLALLDPLTQALAAIHAEHCYHRDIAPDNIILLAGTGRPVLLDFGAARRVIGDMTHALTVILKPGYAPLEQYAEVPSMKQGPWTDVYALAAVVYWAVMGRTPPPAVGRMMSDDYQPLAVAAAGRYSAGFLAAIDRALRVRPEERTASIDELRADLGLGPTGAEPAVTRPAPLGMLPEHASPGAPPLPRTRHRWWIGAGAAALVLGGVGAFLVLAPAPKPAPPGASSGPVSAPAPAPATTNSAGTAPPPAATTQATPPPPPIAAAMPAPPPAPFSVLGEFDRVVQSQSPEFRIEAVPGRETLRIGRDRLSFRVTSQRDGHVYVLVYGPDGSLLQLLPNDAVKDLRARAGQPLTLPPAAWPLDTTEPVGREEFLVIVSQARRDWAAAGAGRDGGFVTLPTGEQGAAAAGRHAGPGSVYAGRAQCDTPGCDAYGAARFGVDVVR